VILALITFAAARPGGGAGCPRSHLLAPSQSFLMTCGDASSCTTASCPLAAAYGDSGRPIWAGLRDTRALRTPCTIAPARVMSGAFRTTSYPALDVDLYLLPTERQIWKHNTASMSGILSSQDILGIRSSKEQRERCHGDEEQYTQARWKAYIVRYTRRRDRLSPNKRPFPHSSSHRGGHAPKRTSTRTSRQQRGNSCKK